MMSPAVRNSVVVFAVLGLGAALVSTGVGCASVTGDDDTGDPEALEQAADHFHTNLRWERYQHAWDVVHDAYRGTIEGKFEERGDDYEIVEMNMVDGELIDGGEAAHVQVDQKWYELPSTVVESERYIERWVFEDDRWLLRERLQRDDYRERGETFESESTTDDRPDQGDEAAGP